MWQHRREPRAWAQGNNVGFIDSLKRTRIGLRSIWQKMYAADLPRRCRYRHLSSHWAHYAWIVIQAGYFSLNIQRLIDHRKHATVRARQHSDLIEGRLHIP